MAASDTRHWYNLRGAECASAVKGICDQWERDQSQRRLRMRRNIELFEGMRLGGLSPSSWFSNVELSSADWDYLRVNIARGLVHTAVAKIAGKQKPKTQFVVNDGDWAVKRKAKKMERFVEANMLAPQGNASDAYELGLEAERDCCVADLGVMKYEPNVERKCVDISRRLPWGVMCDPLDAQSGQPQTIVEVYPYDRFKLAAKFPKFKTEILSAPDITGESGAQDFYASSTESGTHVLVREAYRLPFSKDKPGRRALIVGTADLADEDWELDFFPYEFFIWEKRFTGLYGASIVDNVYHLVGELNAAIQRMSDAERYGSNQYVTAEKGTVDKTQLEGNIAKMIVEYQKGAPAPQFTTPNAISSSTVQWWNLLKGQCFEIPGVSQMGATGQKDPGVDAAVAMRTIENIATERFAPQWQSYERRMSVGSARKIVACGRMIVEGSKETKTKYVIKHKNQSTGHLQDLELKDFDLDDADYQIQPYAVSGLTNTPADRLSLATELLDRQIISQDGYLRVIQAKDIDSELERTNTWSQLIEKYIESWLDATRETEASGEFLYRPPIKFMPLADVIVQVGRAYAFAEMEGAPDYNLGFFIRFMGDCDREIQKIKAQEAALAAQAKGAQPPMLPPDAGALPPPAAAVPPEALPPGGMLQ